MTRGSMSLIPRAVGFCNHENSHTIIEDVRRSKQSGVDIRIVVFPVFKLCDNMPYVHGRMQLSIASTNNECHQPRIALAACAMERRRL
jgi:hypothetical protein